MSTVTLRDATRRSRAPARWNRCGDPAGPVRRWLYADEDEEEDDLFGDDDLGFDDIDEDEIDEDDSTTTSTRTTSTRTRSSERRAGREPADVY